MVGLNVEFSREAFGYTIMFMKGGDNLGRVAGNLGL
jgi:hypothetical protein